MERNLLIEYYKNEKVEPYHGIVTIDALRALSLLDLPAPLKQYVHAEYETAICSMESCYIDDFGERLYEHLNGSEFPIITDVHEDVVTVESFDYDLNPVYTTMHVVNVHFPYFKRLNEYWASIDYRCKIKEDFICYDLRSNCGSFLIDSLKYIYASGKDQRMTDGSYSRSMPWIMDYAQYMIKSHGGFHQPYNGISSDSVFNLVTEMKENPYSYHGENINDRRLSFINRTLIENLCYSVGDEIKAKYRMLTKEAVDKFNKDLGKTINDLWT